MRGIKGYDTFSKIQQISKGMASDKKYRIETADGRQLLLRIADSSENEIKKVEFEMMKKAAALGVPMSQPIDFGTCDSDKSAYTLLTWIDGKEVEAVLPTLAESEQYALGVKSGEILLKIHTIKAPENVDDWAVRYFSVIDERLDAFRREGVQFDGDATILAFLESNRHLLKGRPQCHHHGDYHEGNMILSDGGEISIIDWHTVDFDNYGDPWYEFNRIGTAFPAFASGQIDGYFHGEPPKEFWTLFAYYLAASAITSIVWAKYLAPERLNAILQLNTDVLYWFDNLKNTVPTWYLRASKADTLFVDGKLSVRRLRDNGDDRALLYEWLADPNGVTTVAWLEDVPWDAQKIERKFMPRTVEDSGVTPCIIENDSKAIGYIQFYPIEEDSYLFTPPITYNKFKGGYGVDLFIGYSELWGKGIGAKTIRAMAHYLIHTCGAKVICADPEETNIRSVASWKKAGFVSVCKIPNIDEPGKGKNSILMAYSENSQLMADWKAAK